jgi:uncharacterized DUF497 family protein
MEGYNAVIAELPRHFTGMETLWWQHELSFEEAQHVFSTRDYLEIFDQEHSDTEERFIAIGLINRGLVVVVWTQTEENEIWIISARFATKREEGLYESHRG